MKFLFWNLNKKRIRDLVCHLAHEQDVDVLILAECVLGWDGIVEELNREVPEYRYAWGVCDHLVFFTRFHDSYLRPLAESSRVSIRRLTAEGRRPMLVAAAHLPSKVSFSDDSQIFESVRLSRMIVEVEASEGHHRSLLLGDVNVNSFDAPKQKKPHSNPKERLEWGTRFLIRVEECYSNYLACRSSTSSVSAWAQSSAAWLPLRLPDS